MPEYTVNYLLHFPLSDSIKESGKHKMERWIYKFGVLTYKMTSHVVFIDSTFKTSSRRCFIRVLYCKTTWIFNFATHILYLPFQVWDQTFVIRCFKFNNRYFVTKPLKFKNRYVMSRWLQFKIKYDLTWCYKCHININHYYYNIVRHLCFIF